MATVYEAKQIINRMNMVDSAISRNSPYIPNPAKALAIKQMMARVCRDVKPRRWNMW